MLQFNQSDTAAPLILTLTENVSITPAFFLFVFTHVLTGQSVKFIKEVGEDESLFPIRYNQFTINAAVVFLDKPTGEYHYTVYEQASNNNTDPAQSGAILEYGKLRIYPETPFAFKKYNQPTTFNCYNG